MDLRKIKKLIDLLEGSSLAELEIQEGEETIRLSRSVSSISTAPVTAPAAPPLAAAPAAAPETEPSRAPEEPALPAGQQVTAPMVGTFYSAPSPDAEVFVRVGQEVSKGDTLGVIEAMKMFNQIEAEVAGKVVAILVQNGETVEYGQPMFIIA